MNAYREVVELDLLELGATVPDRLEVAVGGLLVDGEAAPAEADHAYVFGMWGCGNRQGGADVRLVSRRRGALLVSRRDVIYR